MDKTDTLRRCGGVFLFFLLILAPYISCVTGRQESSIKYQQIADGIDLYCVYEKDVPLRYFVVRIDLLTQGLEVVTNPVIYENPESETGANVHEPLLYIVPETTHAFAKRMNCVVAVNASPYDVSYDAGHKIYKTLGLYVLDGILLSAPIEKYAAIMFLSDGTASVMHHQRLDALSDDVTIAVGGFFSILKNGIVNESYKQIEDSRTAIAVNKEGTVLFLLVVEGEWFWQSRGLSYADCARILLDYGAYNALQMDGGGSSVLFIHDDEQLVCKALNNIKKRLTGMQIGFILH